MKAFHPDFRFLYVDAEFTPGLYGPAGLVSLALHTGRGEELYLVNSWCDEEAFRASEFRDEHIWGKLPLNSSGSLDGTCLFVCGYRHIRKAVGEFLEEVSGGGDYRTRLGFVADHGTRDMAILHELWKDDWKSMPRWVPRRPFQDIATLEDIAGVTDGALPDGTLVPEQRPDTAHHALEDARWDRTYHEWLMDHSRAARIASGVERA